MKNKAKGQLRLERQEARTDTSRGALSILAVSHGSSPGFSGMQVKRTQNLRKAVTGKVVTAMFPQLAIKVMHRDKRTHGPSL